LGAQAWVTFWEAIGAGEGVVESIGQLFSGVARYFAQYYAAKALAAAAEALLPPPLGNPAAAAAIPALLAASAAFAAIAGATGGGRRSGSSGGGGRTRADLEPREQEFTVRPRLRGPQFGDQSSQVRPIQPIVVNVGPVIGTNDPQAQRDIARLTSNAVDRGYRLGRGR
jgi:hypothetical protein